MVERRRLRLRLWFPDHRMTRSTDHPMPRFCAAPSLSIPRFKRLKRFIPRKALSELSFRPQGAICFFPITAITCDFGDQSMPRLRGPPPLYPKV
jgi:hypothetical protein